MAEATMVIESTDKVLDQVETEIDLKRQELEKVKLEIEEKKAKLKKIEKREANNKEEDPPKSVIVNTPGNALKEKIEKQKAYDNVMVTGRFMNRRAPGQAVKLPYLKYDTDPVKWYSFEDGKVYTIPRGFADQLNGGTENDPCYYTPHFVQKQGEMDPNKPASAIHHVDASNKKYAFTPVNF